MSTRRVEILSPAARKGEVVTLFITENLCRVGNEHVTIKPRTDVLEKEGLIFFEEDDGTEWRFKRAPLPTGFGRERKKTRRPDAHNS